MTSSTTAWPASSPATPPLPPSHLTEQPPAWEANLHAAVGHVPDIPDDVRSDITAALRELDLLRTIQVGDSLLRHRQYARARAVVEAWRMLERNRSLLPEAMRRALTELSTAVR